MNRISSHEAPAPFGLAVVAWDGTITRADETYAAVHGLEPCELIGRNVSEFTSPGYSNVAMRDLVMRSGQPILTMRDYVRPDGSVVACRVHLCLLQDVDGDPHSILAVVQRIS